MGSPLALSVVVPVHNGAPTLARTLQAVVGSSLPRAEYELIVVDDCSADGSPAVAARYADTFVRLGPSAAGPAYARNRGAELARGAAIAFIDADVVVRPDTLQRMLRRLVEDNTIDAVCARYDHARAVKGLASEYWNLLLNYGTSHRATAELPFFGACSMIRRRVLLSVGMYDEWRFRTACLEDVELGQRLAAGGHLTETSGEFEVTHLRTSNVRRLFRDVWDRSSVLSRSLGYHRTRAAAPAEFVFALSGAAAPMLAIAGAIGLSAASTVHFHVAGFALAALGINTAASVPALRYFASKRGLFFAIRVLPLHLAAQIISVTALCCGWLLRDAIGDREPDATTRAYAELGVEMWPPVPRPR